MDVMSIAAEASAMAQARVEAAVSMAVLKEALDTQEATAMQLLEALPPVPASVPLSTSGAYVDVYA